jgi:hypothetical protein
MVSLNFVFSAMIRRNEVAERALPSFRTAPKSLDSLLLDRRNFTRREVVSDLIITLRLVGLGS